MARTQRARIERSAGGVVVRIGPDGSRVLLINDPYGKWGLPKGHLEGEEGPAEAALREVREETGLTDVVLGPAIGTIDWYFRSGGRLIHKFCDFFLMRSDRGEPRPEVAEGITDCRWVSFDEAMTMVTYQNAKEMIVCARETMEEAAVEWADGSRTSPIEVDDD